LQIRAYNLSQISIPIAVSSILFPVFCFQYRCFPSLR